MLKPLTNNEKLGHTVTQQLTRGTEELLAEVYESGYTGFIDIRCSVAESQASKEVVLNLLLDKLPSSTVKTKAAPSDHVTRWQVVQGKGCRAVPVCR